MIALLTSAFLQPALAAPSWSTSRTSYRDRLASPAAALYRMPKVKTDPMVEPITENFEVVSHLPFRGPTPDADVFLYKHGGKIGKHAYVGSWGYPCTGRGVKIVRTKWPRYPKVVGRAGSFPGTSAEDMVVFRSGARDILAVGIQPCDQGGVGGLALYNVTTPSEPRLLSFKRVPPYGVHEFDVAVRADGRVLALLAANFAEIDTSLGGPPTGGDFRIMDITRPREQTLVSDWGVLGDGPLAGFRPGQIIDAGFEGLGYFAAQFVHSVRSADDGMTAYVSYWDSGILKFDISDPAAPVLLGRTSFPASADGDAHSLAVLDRDGERYLYQNDEDFNPWSILTITSTATANDAYQGVDLFWLPAPFTDREPVSGDLFDAGDGCTQRDFEGAGGKIVLLDLIEPGPGGEEPPCDPVVQIELASAAGATALLINWVSAFDPFALPPLEAEVVARFEAAAPTLPVGVISDNDGFADAVRARPSNSQTTVTITPEPRSWGYLRIFQESTASDINDDGVPEYEQVGEFNDLPHVTGESATTPGQWSIHNTEILGDRAYSSWYSHGIVALDLTDPTAPVKVGQFRRPSFRKEIAFGPDGFPSTWGIVVDPDKDLIYVSDMRSGLWIVRPTGAAAPTVP